MNLSKYHENLIKYPWQRRIERYLAKNQKARALKYLEKEIELDLPLFRDAPEIQEHRRLAWIYRIELLREWGRISEALAWTCLECELNPRNVSAHALKIRLMKTLHLKSQSEIPTEHDEVKPSSLNPWHGVAGMREIKAILEEDIILPLQEPDLYKRYRVNIPNGILLYGPPGCGKTFIARKLSEILDFEFIEVKPSDLASIFVHGGQERIGDLFNQALERAPTLIFFDELDAFVPKRSNGLVGHHYSAEVNEFLSQLNECSKRKILIIGATNLLEKIDPAILRPGRIDKKVFIGPPDFEARVELIKQYMRDRPQDPIHWVEIADETEQYTAAELEFIVTEAARAALKERRNITENDLLLSVEQNPSSIQVID